MGWTFGLSACRLIVQVMIALERPNPDRWDDKVMGHRCRSETVAALKPMYPIAFLGAFGAKNKAVYGPLGNTPEGEPALFGLWIAVNEGAGFWL